MSTPYNRVKFTAVAGGTGDFEVVAAVVGYNTPAQRGIPNDTIISYTAESADKTQWETGEGAYETGPDRFTRITVRENSIGDTSFVDFTDPPVVWIDWHSQELNSFTNTPATPISFTIPAALSAAQGGGNFLVTAGDGGATSGNGGTFDIGAGNAIGSGRGGNIDMCAGDGGSTSGAGGDCIFTCGQGMAGFGGSFSIDCGPSSTTTGGGFVINLGQGGGNGAGGSFVINGSNGSGTGAGSAIDLTAGNAVFSGDANGGLINLETGNGADTGNGGLITLDTGNSGGTSGNGGDITFVFGTGITRNGLFFPNLPTSDPGVPGAMYAVAGIVKISL